MFALFQFPFSDARSFIQTESNRLSTPTWPFPKAGIDFVRDFGPVKNRRRGGINDWSGEGVYCHVSKALRFEQPNEKHYVSFASNFRLKQYCAFRRFFVHCLSSGICVGARFELGFGYRRVNGFKGLNGQDCLAFIQQILNQPVRVQVID